LGRAPIVALIPPQSTPVPVPGPRPAPGPVSCSQQRRRPPMKLYYSPGTGSLAPHIVARETGVAVDLVKVDLKAHKTEQGDDFYAINPRGYVPAVTLDDGSLLTEAGTLVQMLADRGKANGLIPAAGTPERLKVQEWLTFIGTE